MKTPLTLYARRTKGGSVDIFRDSAATNQFCSFDMHRSDRPRHGRKWITLNCYRWKLEWLPDTTPTPDT